MYRISRIFFLIGLLIVITTNSYSQTLRTDAGKELGSINIDDYTLTELCILRNSIYANYGYVFKKDWLNEYFNRQDWYKPNDNFSYDMLTPVDYKNADKLSEYEKEKQKQVISYNGKEYTWKYYNNVKVTEPMPGKFMPYINKYALEEYYNEPPEYLKAEPVDEISKEEYFKILESDEYYYAGGNILAVAYDDNGNIRRLGNKIYDPEGRLIAVKDFKTQTTLECIYYFYWLDDELEQITFIEYSGDDPEIILQKVDFY